MAQRNYKIIGLIRERNESLILKDTLDHFSRFVDGIIVLDDASQDYSCKIAESHPQVLEVIKNKTWEKNNLEKKETKDRQLLLEAAQKYSPTWIFYADADERFEGNIKGFINSSSSEEIDGIRIRLFDAYLTKEDQKPYIKGSLFNHRKYFGPEMREILMLWKNKPWIKFIGLDSREPRFRGKIITKFYCQHYGKSLSTKHWEETCDFYIGHFNKYSEKWKNRKGKAIHTKSDLNRPLYAWEEVKKNPVLIYRYQNLSLVKKFLNKFKKNL